MSLPSDIHRNLKFLSEQVAKGLVRQQEIEKATSVSQSQVSRILAGQARRTSKNVLKLCKYANSLALEKPSCQDDEVALFEQLKRVCQGNPTRIGALRDMLLSIEQLQEPLKQTGGAKC